MQDTTLKTEKRCPKCGVVKEATPQNFYRDRSTKDGLQCWCRVCDLARTRTYEREPYRQKCKRWYQENKERQKQAVKARKVALKERVSLSCGGKCVYCGSTQRLQIDHVVPRSKGGANEISNLVLACQKCNRAKSDKLVEEWLSKK